MPSFDIVSRVNMAEVDNALDGVTREISQRYDFKGSKSSVERNGETITVIADDEAKLRQVHELLKGHLARRKVDPAVLDFRKPEKAAGNTLRQLVAIRQGIDQELAKPIVKEIKASKLKVQVAIQGDELRVSGKNKDDLQQVIALIRGMKLDQPLQYVNFRD